jgi:hypothetical protein
VTLWLTDAEVADATRRRQPAAQMRVLDDWGVPYRRRPDGTLQVGRAAMEAALLRSTMQPSQPKPAVNGLNF